SQTENASIAHFGDALWWAVATISTVGYGDEAPTTAEGRGVGVVLIIAGITFFSVLTANLAAFLTRAESAENEESQIEVLMRKIEGLEAAVRQSLQAQQPRFDDTAPPR
ncbi:MAG: hypothetical protein AMJ77_05630, partial [Dehalococcoidia bacterium SM23_28_2]